MRHIRFIRHYKLAPPFDHWTHMSRDQFINFTEGKLDPSIDTDITGFIKSNKLIFNEYDNIYCSTKKRSFETAYAISQSKDDVQVFSNKLFDEIPSKIIQPITENDFDKMKRLGKIQINKIRILDKTQKISRLKNIENLITNKKENILIVSHSYLIGLLNYWFNIINCDENGFDEVMADKYEIGGILSGFDYEI